MIFGLDLLIEWRSDYSILTLDYTKSDILENSLSRTNSGKFYSQGMRRWDEHLAIKVRNLSKVANNTYAKRGMTARLFSIFS